EVIYGERRRVLNGEDIRENIMSMAYELADRYIEECQMGSKFSEEWNLEGLKKNIGRLSSTIVLPEYGDTHDNLTVEQLRNDVVAAIETAYAAKEAEVGEPQMRAAERMILLRVVDNKWMDHIDAMDQLRTGIGLRGLGQQDPAMAYANEGFIMFEEMIDNIREDAVKYCFGVTIETNVERRQVISGGTAEKEEAAPAIGSGSLPKEGPAPNRTSKQETVRREAPKVGRNDACPCGSGKKYKNCCGKGE
ncbi:MAG: SEC-C domain-containing protein, partial [Firmicutes bacterium]|nr:SEC-C domain-containing protein [Bacillota bacterium]